MPKPNIKHCSHCGEPNHNIRSCKNKHQTQKHIPGIFMKNLDIERMSRELYEAVQKSAEYQKLDITI